MKKGDISYKDPLLALNLLRLAYDREIKDLIYFFKALFGYYDTDFNNFVSFVNHNRTRNCENPSLVLKILINTFGRPSITVSSHFGTVCANQLDVQNFVV